MLVPHVRRVVHAAAIWWVHAVESCFLVRAWAVYQTLAPLVGLYPLVRVQAGIASSSLS